MPLQADDALNENDVSVFRKVHDSSNLSRGRHILAILYDRSLRGPNGVGGVRSHKDTNRTTHPSPSSVVLSSKISMNSMVEDLRETVMSEDKPEKINDDDSGYDSLSQVLNEETDDTDIRSLIPKPVEDIGYKFNFRLKMNAYPKSYSKEIQNFVEHYSVTKFQTEYLSLDRIAPRTWQSHGINNTSETLGLRRRKNQHITETAISTISIDFSPDGRTVASTHGDHTVKISCCNTGALIRSLEGHPRTPWTVKYHPTRSNIVASGCLGYQVRIWDWNYRTTPIEKDHNGEVSDDIYNYHKSRGQCLKMIRLKNSIISLSFHPLGSILAIASGHSLHLWVYDAQKDNTTSTQRNNSIHVNDEDSDASLNETGGSSGNQTVLHQIRYQSALRCVCFPPGGDTIIVGGANSGDGHDGGVESSYSLLLLDFDIKAALVTPRDFERNRVHGTSESDRPPKQTLDVLKNYRSFLPRALLYNDGGFDISRDGKKLCGCAELWLPYGVNSAAELIEKEEKERIAIMERTFEASKPNGGIRTPTHDRKKRKDIHQDSSPPDRNVYLSPPRQGTPPPATDCRTPPNPVRADPTSPPSPPGRRWVSNLGRPERGPGRHRSNRYDVQGSSQSSTKELGRYVPHVVVVSLNTDDGTLGKVLEATPIGSKAASVTCVKYSPSAEFCMIGYGVRESIQSTEGQPYHPVTAMYRVRGGMTQIATMLSREDDVNIARFHPDSGVGFVYGTKQGRVRVLSTRPWNSYYD